MHSRFYDQAGASGRVPGREEYGGCRGCFKIEAAALFGHS